VSDQTDLIQGTLDLLIMRTIALAPMHGWAIAQRIQQISGELLRVQQGSLYPALHRLEHQGWITAAWGASDNNRRARLYSLTRHGA
jgi:PadR family transcriptional regulator, regulatory protein PadR